MSDSFASRRSVVHSKKGIVSSTQPLASAAGLKVLEKGGNAAMASVAVAAALCSLEPMMVSVGGDAFAIFYENSTKKLHGINGSGRTPKAATIDLLKESGVKGPRIPQDSIHSVTVPGAVAAWVDVYEKWGNGKVSLEEALEPVAQLIEDGHPVSHVSAQLWGKEVEKLLNTSKNGVDLLTSEKKAPKEGEVFANKHYARVLRKIGKEGKDGFYKGEIAEKIVKIVKEKGGVMTLEDLADHKSLFVDTVSMEFAGVKLQELPPNGQGLVALQALGILKQLDKEGKIDISKFEHNSADYLHALIETLKYSFKDAEEFVTDIEKLDYDVNGLLSESYLAERAKLFDAKKSNTDFDHGSINPMHKTDTVYFAVTDAEGNACSFINSVYGAFGSAIVPDDCGFVLQNRGCNFNLTEGTRNVYGPSKRPYHTIIPAMITNPDDSLYAAFGVMGGFMQPQGHIQVLSNMRLFGFDPQQALDAPRICLYADSDYKDDGLGPDSPICTQNRCVVGIEEGVSDKVVKELENRGHKVKVLKGLEKRSLFGRGQIIRKNNETGVFSSGGELRGDGAAIAQI